MWHIDMDENSKKMLAHSSSILEAEASRLKGAPTYSIEEIRAKLKEKYARSE